MSTTSPGSAFETKVTKLFIRARAFPCAAISVMVTCFINGSFLFARGISVMLLINRISELTARIFYLTLQSLQR
jgi:hypothetical protein